MKQLKISILALAAISLTLGPACSETIVFTSGLTMTGTIIRTNGNDLLVLTDYGAFDFGKESIKEIKGPTGSEVTGARTAARTPDFKTIVRALSRQKWGADLSPIPATVVEEGIFKNVPYVSFRCSGDYEVNIYGDLKDPAAIEVGVYRKLLRNDHAKNNCLQFVSSLLGETADQELLQSLSREEDLKTRKGLSFQTTPPTGKDAYGGWWVSVFSGQKLDNSRASEKELSEIAMSTTNLASGGARAGDVSGWSAESGGLGLPSTPETVSFKTASGEVVTNAEVVRVVDNAYLIWRLGAGGGMTRLADLPDDLRARFGYDADKASASYAAEEKRSAQLVEERRLAIQAATIQAQQEQAALASRASSGNLYTSHGSPPWPGGRVYRNGYSRRNGAYVRPRGRRWY